ncbi:MAG TPA: MFS transporter [Myxococcota bacterium]|nr:MFS transporter [Myxococcota bacterium]HOA13145.1 MFS transporter [Myxococcota bacterium]HOC99380.1 MFS transporter [Myxococcota bacterium]HOH75997.1 MFS transporter [Myxococcota bacterium]HPV05100.1 MFS transporter [Myxococcota bacterium]
MKADKWFVSGDLNAFFALFVDNVVNLVMLTAILAGQFGMPQDFILTRMIPGTAIGVMFGDLAYTWMACRRGRRMTAMPLGLDTPSTIGMTIAVIGPVFLESGNAMTAWSVGMATLFIMGLFKVVMSFAGDWVQRIVPLPALLGPLAGIGLALLGLIPVMRIFSAPVAGLFATGVILYSIVAGFRLPMRIPGALLAVVAGLIIYWVMAIAGLSPAPVTHSATIGLNWPGIDLSALTSGMAGAIRYLPVSIPFGLLTIVGGINTTASARAAGDDYRTRDILLVESVATLIAGALGGVAQSTPYIGHPAYKAMGARAGYTFLTGIVIGLAGIFGVLGVIIDFVPEVVVAPVLLFVGLAITEQAFSASPRRHMMAVAFSIIPCLAYVITIYTGQLLGAGARPDPSLAAQLGILAILGNGFIVTAILWGSALVFLIDRKPLAVLLTFVTLGVFSLFGVIHSVAPGGGLYLPRLPEAARSFELAAAYVLTGAALAAMLRWFPQESGQAGQ